MLADLHSQSEAAWLSVREGSHLTGVSASTLRRWADAGKVPSQRTLGGHRRFNREAILALASSSSTGQRAGTPSAGAIPDSGELAHQQWHAKLGERSVTTRMRGLGQQVLGLLIQHVDTHEQESRFIGAARAGGTRYGAEACRAAISLHHAVQGFLFFRSACSQWVIPDPSTTQPTDWMAVVALHERIESFMSAVLLGMVQGHEDQRKTP